MLSVMRTHSHHNTFAGRIVTGLLAVSALGLLTGCAGAAAQADASPEGRLDFGCSLVEHVVQEHGLPGEQTVMVGEDADPSVREIAMFATLFRAAEDPDWQHTGQNLLTSVQRVDLEAMEAGVEQAQAQCEAQGVEQSIDVSHENQLDYACNLPDYIQETHGEASEWTDRPDSAGSMLAMVAASATGAANGQIRTDYPDLSEAGVDLLSAVHRADVELTHQAMADFQAACEKR